MGDVRSALGGALHDLLALGWDIGAAGDVPGPQQYGGEDGTAESGKGRDPADPVQPGRERGVQGER